MLFALYYDDNHPEGFSVMDKDSGVSYVVRMWQNHPCSIRIMLHPNGPMYVEEAGTPQIPDAGYTGLVPCYLSKSTGPRYFQDLVWMHETAGAFRIILDKNGSITGVERDIINTVNFPIYPEFRKYHGHSIYVLEPTGVYKRDLDANLDSMPVNGTGITASAFAGDNIFYTVPGGVYRYNEISGETELYSGNSVDIKNIH